MQLGKNGITDNFIECIKTCFKSHDIIKISVLKSAGHNKAKVKEYSEKILDKLGEYYTTKLIGFVIAVKKWRKPKR